MVFDSTSIPLDLEQLLAKSPEELAVGGAVVAGLLAHAYFKRREPTLKGFLTFAAAGSVPLPILLPLKAAGLAFATFFATLGASILFYRLIWPWHPLASIPGPLIMRATQWELFRIVWNGQTRKDMQALHKRYGPVVRIGPNEVSVMDIDSVMVVHGAKSWIKGSSYDQAMTANADPEDRSMISLRTHELHAARRKIWDVGFSMNSLKDYQVVIHDRIGQFCRQMDARADGKTTVDLHKWFGLFVWDVMTDLAYGGGGDKLVTGEDTELTIASLLKSINIAGKGKAMPWISPALKLLPTGLPDFRTNAAILFQKRLKKGRGEHGDVFMHLLGETGKPTNIKINSLAADSALVISAGADTTRLVLDYLFLRMMKDPHRYKELQSYLDEHIGDNDHPRAEELMHLPLMEAFINETLRLSAPVPFANQREAPPDGGVLAGYFIPGGTQARFAQYAMHNNPDWFDHPEEFRPERWMPGYKGRHEKRAFFPFMHGLYHCVGRNFALTEMRLAIATFVRRYDMSFAPGFNYEKFHASIEDRGQIEIKAPLEIVLTRRK